jgi:hypothetical protein
MALPNAPSRLDQGIGSSIVSAPSAWISPDSPVLIECGGILAQALEVGVARSRIMAEFCHGMSPHRLSTAGVEEGFQSLFGRLLRQKAGQVPPLAGCPAARRAVSWRSRTHGQLGFTGSIEGA